MNEISSHPPNMDITTLVVISSNNKSIIILDKPGGKDAKSSQITIINN